VGGRIFLDGTFEFHHHDRQAIDEQDPIRYAIVLTQDLELVDDFKVVVCMIFKIDQRDPNVFLGTILALERKAILKHFHKGFVALLEIRRWQVL
jgi:hypothetical protein